ncbi:hypothetical protein Tco_1304325 [Tanacetum coccineum]
MSRTNSQIVSEEQLVPRANRLVIKKNNQHIASDLYITDTMLRFVVEILRHHKLYKPASLTATVPIIYLHQFWATINHNKNNHTFTFELENQTFTLTPGLLRIVLQMPPPDPNNTYIQPPLENQILEFINKLGYDEDPETKCLTRKDSSWDTIILPILQILWGIVHSANLDFASLIWDEFKWETVKRSSRPSKISKLLYTRFTKLIIDYLLSLNKCIPYRSDSNDAIKKKAGYKNYMAKKVESEKAKSVDKPEEQHVSPIKSGRGKGFMCYGDQVAIVPNKLKKDVLPRKTRSLTIAEEALVDKHANSIRSKASRLESLRQKKQPVAGEGSSVAHNKYYSSSDTASDETLYSSSSDESANETDDAEESDKDLSNDNPYRDDDDASKENSLSYKNSIIKLLTRQSKEADAKGEKAIRRKIRGLQECSHIEIKEYDSKLASSTNFNVFLKH